jgi:hypothetical protein
MGEAVPSRSGNRTSHQLPTLQLASRTATGSDGLRPAHHARGAGRDERRRGRNKPVGQGGEPVGDSQTA